MSLQRRSARKAVFVTLSVLVVLWVFGCAAIYHAMRQPPEFFGHVMARIPGPVAFLVFPFETMWMRARGGTLSVGDSAPDFKLTRLDHSGDVQLASFAAQGRPLVLIFGSYT